MERYVASVPTVKTMPQKSPFGVELIMLFATFSIYVYITCTF